MNARLPVNVSVTRRFKASPERVFDAWFDPRGTMLWIAATSTLETPGEMLNVRIDARVGGSFSFVGRRHGEEIDNRGEYLEIDQPQLLVFTCSAGKRSNGETRVVVEIVPRRDGCELTLVHVGVHPDHSIRAESGWMRALDAIANLTCGSLVD